MAHTHTEEVVKSSTATHIVTYYMQVHTLVAGVTGVWGGITSEQGIEGVWQVNRVWRGVWQVNMDIEGVWQVNRVYRGYGKWTEYRGGITSEKGIEGVWQVKRVWGGTATEHGIRGKNISPVSEAPQNSKKSKGTAHCLQNGRTNKVTSEITEISCLYRLLCKISGKCNEPYRRV